MKKEIHPAVTVIAVLIIVGVVAFFFMRSSQSPEPQGMSPMGPAAKMLKGDDMSKHMTPEEKMMMQRSMGARGGGAAGPVGMPGGR
jgi:hypothetical protein